MLFFLLLFIPVIGVAQENGLIQEKINSLPKEVKKEFRIDYDKFEKTTNIFSKKSDGSNIKLNIVTSDNNCILRIYSFYSAKTWMFIEDITFLIDNETYKFEVKNNRVEQIGIGYGIAERTYTLVDEYLLDMIKKLLNSNSEINVRFEGKDKYQDFKLSKKNIEAMKETFDLYNQLKS